MASSLVEGGAITQSQPLGGGDGLGFDIAVFKIYLQTLLPPGEICSICSKKNQRGALRANGSVMSATPQELEDSLFSDPSFDEKALRFATDSVCQVVYITRERLLDVDADEDGESPMTMPTEPSRPGAA
jgi:dynein heavy chain 1